MKLVKSSLFWITALLLGLGLIGWLIAGDPIHQSKWDAVKVGMSKDEVIEILGKPDSLDGNQLEYSRFGNVGWTEFAFDANDELIWKNDESVFGSLDKPWHRNSH
jgi:hypothetical protein